MVQVNDCLKKAEKIRGRLQGELEKVEKEKKDDLKLKNARLEFLRKQGKSNNAINDVKRKRMEAKRKYNQELVVLKAKIKVLDELVMITEVWDEK